MLLLSMLTATSCINKIRTALFYGLLYSVALTLFVFPALSYAEQPDEVHPGWLHLVFKESLNSKETLPGELYTAQIQEAYCQKASHVCYPAQSVISGHIQSVRTAKHFCIPGKLVATIESVKIPGYESHSFEMPPILKLEDKHAMTLGRFIPRLAVTTIPGIVLPVVLAKTTTLSNWAITGITVGVGAGIDVGQQLISPSIPHSSTGQKILYGLADTFYLTDAYTFIHKQPEINIEAGKVFEVKSAGSLFTTESLRYLKQLQPTESVPLNPAPMVKYEQPTTTDYGSPQE